VIVDAIVCAAVTVVFDILNLIFVSTYIMI
jgi:hypothetical protein